MNEQDLQESLEHLSHTVPEVDATGMARTATALAVRSRRRTYALAVPSVAAAAVAVVVASGAALQSGAAKPGEIAPLAGSTAATATAVAPSAVAPSAAPSAVGAGADLDRQHIAYGAIGGWTCCDDADRAEVVKPGGDFVAHFRSIGAGASGPVVTLTVVLTGPFADVKAMMADPPVRHSSRYAARPLTLPAAANGSLSATVAIPATAAPGLYLISLDSGGASGSAGSVEITR